MTEAEWLNEGHNSQAMVCVLRGTKVTRTKAGKRKLRLFACACCRLTWDLLTDPLLRQAVEVAERFAEGQTGKADLEKAYESARRVGSAMSFPDESNRRDWIAASLAAKTAQPQAFSAAFDMTAYPVPASGAGYGVWEQKRDRTLCRLLRCVFGNPFRPAPLDPAWIKWNDGVVVRIAQGIYEDLAFDRMPVLADALEDSGCTEAVILDHCRGPGEHVRGCWVVDLCLGRSG